MPVNFYRKTLNSKMRILCCLLLFISSDLVAKEVSIQGFIKDFENKKIKLATVSDYITNQKEYRAETIIRDNQFSFQVELEQTRQLILKIEDKESSFFAEPGGAYSLQLSYDEEKNRGQAYNKILDLKMAFPKAGELNQKIKAFNQEYQGFFAEHYEKFVVKAAQKELTAFIAEMKDKAFYQTPEFMANYARYALANLEDINHASDEDLMNTYLIGQPILYHHKEYMNFFMQFFQSNFAQFCITKEGAELLKAIMLEKNLDRSLQLILSAKGFQQKALAELYLINGLFEVYHQETVEQESNLLMLEKIAESGVNRSNRKLAAAVKSKLESFGKDLMASSFSLYNEKEELISSEELKGQYVYLGFWANWSIPSLKELKVIEKLYEQYGDQVHFVSINVDDNLNDMAKVIAANQYEWIFLHYGNDYELREKYQARAIPSYYLINPEGKLEKTFAEGPVEVEKKLYELSREGKL
jgi:thiol-disulfide isomerase/thioredoxin